MQLNVYQIINTPIQHQLSRFREQSLLARQLLKTYLLASMVTPIIITFTNAYIWRETQMIEHVVLFNLFLFASMLTGYYLSGQLMKFISVKLMYILGFFVRVSVPLLLILQVNLTPSLLIIVGIYCGIGLGLYWSTRNYFTLFATDRYDRTYFSSFAVIFDSLFGIVVPLIAGYLITFGEHSGLYPAEYGYLVLAVLVFIPVLFLSVIVNNTKVDPPKIKHIFLGVAGQTKVWKTIRMANVAYGALNAITTVVPVLLILYYVGKEDSLGILLAASVLLSISIIYLVGKRLTFKHRKYIVGLSLLLIIIGTTALALGTDAAGVLIYQLSFAIAWPIINLEYGMILQDTTELVGSANDRNNFPYLFDSELFFSFGRVFGLALLFILATVLTGGDSLKVISIVLILVLLFLLRIITVASKLIDSGYAQKDQDRV